MTPRANTRDEIVAYVNRAANLVAAKPQFGFKARVPLSNGRGDRTEVDMRLGDLLVEAKLTESDFQRKSAAVVETYRDFKAVFDARDLPRKMHDWQRARTGTMPVRKKICFCVVVGSLEFSPWSRSRYHRIVRTLWFT